VTDSPPASADVATTTGDVVANLAAEIDLEPCPPATESGTPVVPGLPDEEFPCLGGGPAVNLAALRGTPMVVNVWASWCPPCVDEMPILAAADEKYDGIQFLGVTIQDDPVKSLELLKDVGVVFPSVVDPAGSIRAPLLVTGPPVTFFIDAKGIITGRFDGAIPDVETMDALIAEHLTP
jgi:thiol-disulfide isomerase/thioredoxin